MPFLSSLFDEKMIKPLLNTCFDLTANNIVLLSSKINPDKSFAMKIAKDQKKQEGTQAL